MSSTTARPLNLDVPQGLLRRDEKKNRLGQRARRALAEKMFGGEAKHLHEGKRDGKARGERPAHKNKVHHLLLCEHQSVAWLPWRSCLLHKVHLHKPVQFTELN